MNKLDMNKIRLVVIKHTCSKHGYHTQTNAEPENYISVINYLVKNGAEIKSIEFFE